MQRVDSCESLPTAEPICQSVDDSELYYIGYVCVNTVQYRPTRSAVCFATTVGYSG